MASAARQSGPTAPYSTEHIIVQALTYSYLVVLMLIRGRYPGVQILDGNDIGHDGTICLCDALLQNASVKLVSLRRNSLLANAGQVRGQHLCPQVPAANAPGVCTG